MFYSNPFDNLSVINSECESFFFDSKAYLHFYLDEKLNFIGKEVEHYVVNKTDLNQQYFNLTFSTDLEFLDLFENSMFFREQNPQSESIDIPSVKNSLDYIDFISTMESYKLFESEKITLGESKTQDTNLISIPQSNLSVSVAKDEGKLLLNRWPI